MVELVDPEHGRVVNVSSGSASGWVKNQGAAVKKLFSNPDITLEELDAAVNSAVEEGRVGSAGESERTRPRIGRNSG